MDKLKFIIVLLGTISLTYLINNPISLESNPVPPLGKLLNPFTGFWQNAEKINSTPQLGSLKGLKLNAPVKVIYDDKLVPHIFAESMIDAITVQGYIEILQRRKEIIVEPQCLKLRQVAQCPLPKTLSYCGSRKYVRGRRHHKKLTWATFRNC